MGIIVTKVREMLKFLRKPSSPDPGSSKSSASKDGSGATTPVIESKMTIFCKIYSTKNNIYFLCTVYVVHSTFVTVLSIDRYVRVFFIRSTYVV